MYLNCVLQKFLWCLPCKMPYGNGHYVTGCDLVLLSNVISIEQCLTNFSCNLLGRTPKKSPYVLNGHRKEKQIMSQGYNNWGCCNYHKEEDKKEECCCKCCCPKKEEPKKQKCATIKVCIEEEKREEKKEDKKEDGCY